MFKLNNFVFHVLLAAFIVLSPLATTGALAEETRKIAIHVDDNDPKRMNMALNNAQNLRKYYDEKGIATEIRIVAYGRGLMMLRSDKSPVADRIATMSLEFDNLSFAACGNTHRRMSEKEGASVSLLDEAVMVPSGVVELVELQRQGWSYLRP